MTQEHVRDSPATGVGALVRAALPSVPLVNRLPGVRKSGEEIAGLTHRLPGVRVQREEVRRYAAVCGFPAKDAAPPTYPHLLAFPLQLAIMSSPAFPWPAIGAVHLENTLTAHRAVRTGEELDVIVTAGSPRPHPKGSVIDLVTRIDADGEPVWDSVSTYLRRGPGHQDAPSSGLGLSAVPSGTVEWRLPADLGRRYAAVSGDLNPIHLYPLTARALGFPRQIAHGMWSVARCVAAIENRLPEAVTVQAAFRKAVLLPGTVGFGMTASGPGFDGGFDLALTRPRDGAPHLLARAVPA